MKVSQTHILTLVLCSFLFSNVSFGQVDSIELGLFDTLRMYKAQDSFDAYIETLKKASSYYKETNIYYKNNTDAFKIRCNQMVALCDSFNIYREPENDEEKHLVRWYYATKFFWIRKAFNDDNKSLPIGLKGTEYVVDPEILDKHAFIIEMPIGGIYARQNDDSRAILYYKKCLPWLERTKNYKRLSSLCANIGSSYTRLGEYENAKKYFQKGINASRKIDCLDCYLAHHARLRDLAYEKGDKKLFLQLADEGKKMLNKHKEDPNIQSRFFDFNKAMGTYYFNEKKHQEALPYFLHVKAFLNDSNASNRQKSKNSANIAQCYLALDNTGKFKEEIKYCNEQLFVDFNEICPPDSLLFAENSFLELFDICSAFYTKEYYKTKAIATLDTALMFLQKVLIVNELIDQRILYSNSKTKFANEGKEYVDKAVDLAYSIQEIKGETNSSLNNIRKLFNASKDQILKDKFDLQTRIDKLDNEDRKMVDSLVSIIVTALATSRRDNTKIIECQDEIEKITGTQLNEDRYVELKGDYLEYLVTPKNVYLLSRTNNKLKFQKLGWKEDFDSLLTAFNIEIKSSNLEDKWSSIYKELGEFLIPPKLNLSKSFTVIPDQKIATIPFDLLEKENKFLIEEHITSTQTHYLQKLPIEDNTSVKILCLNPNYPFNGSAVPEKLDRSGFYPLPFAKQEISNLKSLFTSIVDVVSATKAESISTKLQEAKIFHFAGHAKVNQDSAYLVLHDSNSFQKWTYDEIYPNNFDLSLVTLSACETGLGEVQYGDGLNSLARGFLGAGADAVVYSLWTVNDMSTSTIMNDFYSELKKGMTKDQAIRKAKLNYLASANPDRRHPYFWGGFVATGEMTPIYFSTPLSKTKIILTVLCILLVGAILLKTLKTKHL